jgi:hypothetical protein
MTGSELSSTPKDYATSLIASTDLLSTPANTQLENEAMHHLIRDNAAQNVISNITGSFYANGITGFGCTANNYGPEELDSCDISTTPGLHDGSVVVSTYHNQARVTSNDSQKLNVGIIDCVHDKFFTVDEPTNSIYDSHLQITSTPNDGPFLFENSPLDNAFEATFANGGEQKEMHKIFNSKYGNVSGLNKMYVQEETSFNTTHAMGMTKDKYFSLNSSDGTRSVNDLPNSNKTEPNNIGIVETGIASVGINDCGTYRIQQLPDSTEIEVYNNDVLVNDSSVSNIPIHTKNTLGHVNTDLTRLPVDPLTPPQFRSIFDRDQDIILPEYEFKVEVTKNADDKSGIGFNEDTDIKTSPEIDTLMELDTKYLMELDNRYLQENPYFIKEFASETGTLTFQPAKVAIDSSSNGFLTNIYNGSNNGFKLDTGREKLMKDFYNKNGQIILNKGTTLTRTETIQNETTLSPEISYEGEYSSFISEADKENHYVDYKAQLVFKNPYNDINFVKNNTSNLNLILGDNVENAYFNASEWNLLSANAVSNTNEVWKIVPKIRLDGVEALKDSTGVAVPSVFSNASMQNISVPLAYGSFNAKAKIDLRPVSSLSFYNAFTERGWQLSSSNDGLLEASSTVAFYPENSSYFPDPAQMYDLVDGSGGALPFKVRFNPGISNTINSSLASDFSDRVEITWGNSNILKIPQEKLTRINQSSSPVTTTVIPAASYNLIGYLSGKNVVITKYTSVKNYQIQFNLGLRSYSTLTVTSPMYTIESEYYIGTDAITGEIYPSGLLSFAASTTTPTIDFTKISEQVTSTTNLFVESSIQYDDVKELNVQIQIQNGAGVWSAMSESIYVSSFYSKTPTLFNLLPTYDNPILAGADISILIQYQYMNNQAQEISVTYNDQLGYYMDLNNDYTSSSFDLYSWASSVEDTGSNSSIGRSLPIENNELFISPSDGFSSIQSKWNTTTYRLQVSYTESVDSSTILRIIKSSDNSLVHTVTIQNNTAIGTPIYIARSPSIDTWRIVKTIGNDLATATSTERFMSTNYTDSATRTNSFEIESGVQLIRASLNLGNSETCGKLIRFSLLSDNIGVNMTGDVTLPLNRITWNGSSTDTTDIEGIEIPDDGLNLISENGLNFRAHRNFNTYSKSFILKYYRGYLGEQNVNQIYTVTREVTKATVKWEKLTGTPESYEQRDIECFHRSVPPGYNKGDTLNPSLYSENFVNNMRPRDVTGSIVPNQTAFTDIGLLLLPEYSMLSDSDTRSFPIYTKGDSIQITISNPNNTLLTPSPVPGTTTKTLKDYDLYSFSGTSYYQSGEQLKLYSTKLKSDSNMKYTLYLTAGNMVIYKHNNYLGNPVSRGQVNPLVHTSPDNWGEIQGSGSYRPNLVGLSGVPGYTIKRIPNVNYTEAVTFFVLHAPMHRFNIIPYSSCPTSLPIDDSVSSPVNKQFCLPVTDKSGSDSGPKYNPFKSSRVWTNIDDTSVTITNDNTKINDVEFYHKNPRLASDFVLSPNSSIRKFNITGSIININLFLKLKSETSPTLLTALYNGYASGLLSLDMSNNPLLGRTNLRLSDSLSSGTGAKVSFLQSGIPPFSVMSNVVFGISNITNVTFTIPFFFLGSVISPIKLDLPTGPGTILNMYTRSIQKDIYNGATNIVLYKYIPIATIVDWNNSTLSDKTVINAIFDRRCKKVFPLPLRTLDQYIIQTFDDLINLIPKSAIASATWEDDVLFNKQVRFTFSSYNLNCIKKTLPKFMSPPNNLGHAKFNIVTRTKALQVKDKFGYPLADIDHDGIIRVNTISTGTMILNDVDLSNPDTLAKVNQRPVVTFGRGKNI